MNTPLHIEIVPAGEAVDLLSLRPALETAICHPFTREVITDEVEQVMTAVRESADGLGNRFYAIAQTSGGIAVGVMGLQSPDPAMRIYTTTVNPIEITNAYLDRDLRGQHVGTKLVSYLELVAREQGNTEIVLNSGPRYARSGWPFWRKTYGDPVAIAKNYYGPRYDAMIWRKLLSD